MKFVAALLLATAAAVTIRDNDDKTRTTQTPWAGSSSSSSSAAHGDDLPDILKPKAPLTALLIYGLMEKCNELFRKNG